MDFRAGLGQFFEVAHTDGPDRDEFSGSDGIAGGSLVCEAFPIEHIAFLLHCWGLDLALIYHHEVFGDVSGLQDDPSFRVVLPSYLGAHFQFELLPFISHQDGRNEWNLSFIVVGRDCNPVVAQSFIVLIVFGLSLGHLFDEIHKGIFLSATPDLGTQDLSLVAALICLKSGISCEEIGELSQDGNDSIEVQYEGGADEGDGEGKELDLKAGLGSDVSVANGGGGHDEFVEYDVVLRQGALFVSQGKDLVCQHHHSQKQKLHQSISQDGQGKLEDASE